MPSPLMCGQPPAPPRFRAGGERTRCECGRPSGGRRPASTRRGDCPEVPRVATVSPRQAPPPERRPQPPRSREIFSQRSRAPAASIPATGARSEHPWLFHSRQFSRRAAHHLPHLDRYIPRDSSRPGRRRQPRGDFIRLLGAFHVNDCVSGEKLLGFREDAVRHKGRPVLNTANDAICHNRLPVAPGANDPGLVRESQAFGRNEHARILEFLVESMHESGLRLVVLRRPLSVPVKFGLRARQHQNVLHVFFLLLIPVTPLAPFHGVVGANPRFSTSLKFFLRLLSKSSQIIDLSGAWTAGY